jgi:two-component system, response regulator
MMIDRLELAEILLVEDNPNDVELTLRALKKNRLSNKILVVSDGEEALKYIFPTYPKTEKHPALSRLRLILLDLKLPKVDGVEVLKILKKNPLTAHIPIVVLTSSREDKDLIETYRLGVNSYITKPVEFANFTDAIREIGMYWLLLNQLPPELT